MKDNFINNISVDVIEDLHVLLDNTQRGDDVIINSVVSALCNTLNGPDKISLVL